MNTSPRNLLFDFMKISLIWKTNFFVWNCKENIFLFEIVKKTFFCYGDQLRLHDDIINEAVILGKTH